MHHHFLIHFKKFYHNLVIYKYLHVNLKFLHLSQSKTISTTNSISTTNAADVDDKDDDENTGDDASDLETKKKVPKTSTTEKVAVPKTSKKRGPRGPFKK